ncbi:hypothetical protein SCA05_12360 [Staphylococcus carnosus]|nr:hypothetical protein SCA05_12360 [Staphylococcus carnosus]SUM05255.1 Acid phosphatase [Staphylococcus carnosus]
MAAKAKPVYGAKDFLHYANKKGVAIYYVSDRDKDTELEATSKNKVYHKMINHISYLKAKMIKIKKAVVTT